MPKVKVVRVLMFSLYLAALHLKVGAAAFAPGTSIIASNGNKYDSIRSPLIPSSTANSAPRSSTILGMNDEREELEIIDRRRAILNLILSSAPSAAAATFEPIQANALSFGTTKKEAKPTTATDIAGSPIMVESFLSKHKSGDRTMVQGLKGDPTYLIVKMDTEGQEGKLQIESYALNAECTHLGCVVPWDPIQAKFVCPCHGSQYDARGSVLRGPAPGSLQLAKVEIEEESGKVVLEPWIEDDFRSGEKPWWI